MLEVFLFTCYSSNHSNNWDEGYIVLYTRIKEDRTENSLFGCCCQVDSQHLINFVIISFHCDIFSSFVILLFAVLELGNTIDFVVLDSKEDELNLS